jgi:hypothetical protein
MSAAAVSMPYREPSTVSKNEEPLTDEEIRFWDAVVVSMVGQPDRRANAEHSRWIAEMGDLLVRERRSRVGIR